MATLADNIRLNTEVNLQGFIDLTKQLSQIQLSLAAVASAARDSANVQKEQINSVLNAEKTAETERNARSERRRLNKIANVQAETQAELNAIKVADAASRAAYSQQIRNINLYNAQLKNKSQETNNAQKASDGLFSSFTSLTSLRSQLVGLFGALSVGSFAQQMVEAQSKVESFELSMKNLLGAGYGAKLVSDLKQFTVETPLNFEDVIKSASQLVGSFKAAGASSKTIATEIPQILDSLGNSAAALGGETRLGRLVYAFSQVQATGRLMGTEVRQITETGFPLLAVLTDSLNERFPKLSLSVADVQKRVSEGKVSFEDFKIAILSAGKEGGVFAGSMDIMANTVQGRIDKLKESMFFAFANIGDQFNNTAKDVINFASNVVQALFGTESATRRTIEILKTVISTWIAYTAATKLAAAQTVIGTTIDRISLIVRGQMALANITLTGSTNTLTSAQLRAAVAARAFNTAAMANPLGLLVLGIGAVVGAYQLYTSSVEQAEENQKKLSNEIASSVAPIKTQQAEFDNLAKAVLSTSLPLSEQEKILNKLKLQYPILLKGVTDLSTAEEILNNNKHKTNSTLDFRKAKLEELKKKYPEQLKGIDTLAEAELKLGGVVKSTDRDFAILSATMENNIRIQNQVAGANDNFAKKIKAQGDLAKLRSGQTGSNLVDFGGNIIDNTPALIEAKEKEIASYDKAAKGFVKAAEVIRAKNEELTSKLKYNWKEIPKTIEKTGQEGKEKALKYQADTAEQMKIASNKIIAEDMDSSRQKDLILRNLEYRNQQERINNAIGSQKIKNKLLLDLEQEYDANISKIHQTWDVREETDKQKAIKNLLKADGDYYKASIDLQKSKNELSEKLEMLKLIMAAKSSKEIERIEQETADNILISNEKAAQDQLDIEKKKLDTFKEGTLEYIKQHKVVLDSEAKLNDAQEKMADLTLRNKKKRTNEEESEQDRIIKLKKDNQEDSYKISQKGFALEDKLRTIDKIKRGKTLEEIEDDEFKSKVKRAEMDEKNSKRTLDIETDKLNKLSLAGKAGTEEFLKQQKQKNIAEEEYTDNADKLAELRIQALYKELQKRKEFYQLTLSANQEFLSRMESDIDKSISDTSNAMDKAQAESQKAGINIAKKGLSSIQSFISGDIVSGTLNLFDALYGAVTLIGDNASRMSKAQMEIATEALENYLKVVDNDINMILSRFDDIKYAYGQIKSEKGELLSSTLSPTFFKDLALDSALKSLVKIATSVKEVSKDILNIPQIDLGNLSLDFKTIDEWRYAIGVTGFSVAELIQAEITRGQQIQKTYEVAISNEDKLYETNKSNNEKINNDSLSKIEQTKNKSTEAQNTIYNDKIKNIKDAYDEEVKLINAKFDLEATRANQKYDKETLAILASGSKQLEALITNEISLNDVRTEFASKRQFILDSYSLANKAITADMSQEEIAGINAAIKARDESLAKLQKWYNDELTSIANSEGQKRKEYTDTEKIQNGVNDRLEKASIKFNADEITRVANRNIELKKELDKKELLETDAETKKTNALIAITGKYESDKADLEEAYHAIKEAETNRYNAAITALENKKNADIDTSFKILTQLLKLYAEDITKAMEDSTAKGSDAYKQLAGQLEIVNDLLKQIKANSIVTFGSGLNVTTNALDTGIGFEKGTDDTSVALKGQRVVDNKGGWQAILHPQEAVFSKADMTQMETVFGKRPTRQEVIENFKIGVVNQVTPQMNPFVIQKMQANGVGNFDKLGDKIERLAKEVSKKMSPVVYVDKGGIRTYYKNLNSQIEVKNQRFK